MLCLSFQLWTCSQAHWKKKAADWFNLPDNKRNKKGTFYERFLFLSAVLFFAKRIVSGNLFPVYLKEIFEGGMQESFPLHLAVL